MKASRCTTSSGSTRATSESIGLLIDNIACDGSSTCLPACLPACLRLGCRQVLPCRSSALAYALVECAVSDPGRYAVAQRLGDLMEEFEYDENPLGYMQEASL